MRRPPVRPAARRRNPAYDEDAYRRALAGDKNLEGANLEGANLKGANLLLANLAGSNLAHINLEDASLLAANLASARLAGANLASASLLRANFTGADLTGANLEDADLIRANLEGANLPDANLTYANLTYANLFGANLEGANLTGASLDDANLKDAYLLGANLTRANLRGANLRGANLLRANLEGANVEAAYWDVTTRWPFGFVPSGVAEHLTFSDPTGSAAFRRWFGESVVKDETGRPVVVYHGTQSGGFTVFDPAKADAHHPGFYFTDDILTANTYVGKKRATLPDPVSGDAEGAYRLYIKMERPFIHDAKGGQWNDLHVPQFPGKRKTYEVATEVKDTGIYDGVIFKNLRDSGGRSDYDEPADVYVVFDPKNIKSATANVGTYDPNDPDIRHNPRAARRHR